MFAAPIWASVEAADEREAFVKMQRLVEALRDVAEVFGVGLAVYQDEVRED
jgi:hypothetical protein